MSKCNQTITGTLISMLLLIYSFPRLRLIKLCHFMYIIMYNGNGSEKWHKVTYIDKNSTYE